MPTAAHPSLEAQLHFYTPSTWTSSIQQQQQKHLDSFPFLPPLLLKNLKNTKSSHDPLNPSAAAAEQSSIRKDGQLDQIWTILIWKTSFAGWWFGLRSVQFLGFKFNWALILQVTIVSHSSSHHAFELVLNRIQGKHVVSESQDWWSAGIGGIRDCVTMNHHIWIGHR